MKRLFVAIKIYPTTEFLRIFSQLTSDLRHERIKWVEPHNIHITLKFFGETEENEIPAIKSALQLAASQSKVFTMKISRTGIFGSRYDPKVIWFGIERDSSLDLLARNTLEELKKAGWEPDRQNFVPHLTVGRIRELRDKEFFQQVIDQYRDAKIQEQLVKEVILYESILKPQGPTYISLAKFQIGQ
jgi:2'-5' RNA ligase